MSNNARPDIRPKLGLIQGNPEAPDKPDRVRRVAQPGEILLPRVVFYRSDLKPTTRLVAGWLYDHLKPGTHTATGSQKTIAEELGLTKPTVIKALDELWKNHIIMSTTHQSREGGGYFLTYEMRVFPQGEERKRHRPRVKKAGNNKVAKASKAADQPQVASAVCPKCRGTGWEYNNEIRASRPCECRGKPKGGVKPR